MKNILNNFLWMVLGGLLAYLFLKFPEYHFDSNLSVNIVIAIATCAATALHFDTVRMNRKNRIWDINKDILLDLTNLLCEMIYETEKSVYNPNLKNNNKIHVELSKKINNAINVYKPLLGDELTKELLRYKDVNNRINSDVFNEDLDIQEAYQKSLDSSINLHKNLLSFIGKVSGVN